MYKIKKNFRSNFELRDIEMLSNPNIHSERLLFSAVSDEVVEVKTMLLQLRKILEEVINLIKCHLFTFVLLFREILKTGSVQEEMKANVK